MKEKFRYVKKEDRKKILLLCDDIRVHSGVGTMAKEIVIGTAHHFNWLNVGAAIQHPEAGKGVDISAEINKLAGIEDSWVRILPNNGYGDANLIRRLIKEEKPDAIMIFTDPRYWVWLFELEREIRNEIPIMYYSIWDNWPLPIWNQPFYESCDLHMCISKQTKEMTKMLLQRSDMDVVDLDLK